MTIRTPVHLAVALDGAGWHPAAGLASGAPDARQLLTLRHWADVVQQAERGLLDFVTFEDAFDVHGNSGQLDAVLLASALAPLTRRIGLVPTAVATHTEPFHLAKAIATLDHVSHGRGGVRVRVSAEPGEAANVGRRDDLVARAPGSADNALLDDLFSEAADWIEVQRRLWDSWEDDAEIRDVATGRFVDRAKLHYIDFTGARFSVKGPLITQRPPQGQPVVVALAHVDVAFDLVATSADVGLVTPHVDADVPQILAQVPRGLGDAGRSPLVFADLVVVLDATAEAAQERLGALNALAGGPLVSDARVFTGTPAELADLLLEWQALGLDGFRLRPASTAHDLPQITGPLVKQLHRRRALRTEYEADTLRGLLGLERPDSRYAIPSPSARTA